MNSGLNKILENVGNWNDIIDTLDQVAEQPLEAEQLRRLRKLCATIAGICRETGCCCLANRFEALSTGARAAGTCPAVDDQTRNSAGMLQIVCKLGPLTRALADAGYFDIALLTVELAMKFEPTLENDLARAYLFVILGETDAANEIYQQAVLKRGDLPSAELKRLAQLVETHADEEDIKELLKNLQDSPTFEFAS